MQFQNECFSKQAFHDSRCTPVAAGNVIAASSVMMLRDRSDAGRRLAQKLHPYAGAERTVVIGLPRGGVVTAAEIARILSLPLDVLIVRKLGVPWQPELAFGAIASGGVRILHQDLIRDCGLSVEEIDSVTASEQEELDRRERLYCGIRTTPDYRDWQVIVADDGIATGATLEAAIAALRLRAVRRIVVAAGVAQRDSLAHFQGLADEVVAVVVPDKLGAISMWYQSFPQTQDQEVTQLLRACAPETPPASPRERQP